MAFVVVEKGNARDVGKRFSIGEKALLIGRQTPQNEPDIPLNDDYVSRRHAEIAVEQGRFVVRDLGSTNGTTLDDERLTPGRAETLRHDSVVGIGVTGGSARNRRMYDSDYVTIASTLPVLNCGSPTTTARSRQQA